MYKVSLVISVMCVDIGLLIFIYIASVHMHKFSYCFKYMFFNKFVGKGCILSLLFSSTYCHTCDIGEEDNIELLHIPIT